MPQLMPLNWIFSSCMIIMLLVGASVVYGNKMDDSMEVNYLMKENKLNSLWLW